MIAENEKSMKWKMFLQRALSEDNGNPSSMRINATWTIFLLILVIAFGFMWVVLKYEEVIIAYLAIISSLVSGVLGIKAYQKTKEEGSDSGEKKENVQ